MAVFPLKIAPKRYTKKHYPSIPAVTAESGGFSMKEALCRKCQKSGRKSLLSSNGNLFPFMTGGAEATMKSAGNVSMDVSMDVSRVSELS